MCLFRKSYYFISRGNKRNFSYEGNTTTCPVNATLKGYRHAYFQCYDGEESPSTGREACKSAEFWKKFAENFCRSHCSEKESTEKCGVNTLSLTDECYYSGSGTEQAPSETNRTAESGEIEGATEELLFCKNACPLNEKCYPFGYRKSGQYCSDDGKFIDEKAGDETCENNFECDSNVCIDGTCVSQNLIQKFIAWFKNLFG